MRHWLMKSEPDVFGIEHLRAKGTAPWDGVRNYVARNHMMEMAVGDRVLFYHSSCQPPGVAGLAEVARTAYPDHTQFDPKSDYFDPKATPDRPRWRMVDVRFVGVLPRLVALDEIRAVPELRGLLLFKYNRLSVIPVTPEEYASIVGLARRMATPAEQPTRPTRKVEPMTRATRKVEPSTKPTRAIRPKAKTRPRT
jgi:predicted RNA-binding protein with PUA-like domain